MRHVAHCTIELSSAGYSNPSSSWNDESRLNSGYGPSSNVYPPDMTGQTYGTPGYNYPSSTTTNTGYGQPATGHQNYPTNPNYGPSNSMYSDPYGRGYSSQTYYNHPTNPAYGGQSRQQHETQGQSSTIPGYSTGHHGQPQPYVQSRTYGEPSGHTYPGNPNQAQNYATYAAYGAPGASYQESSGHAHRPPESRRYDADFSDARPDNSPRSVGHVETLPNLAD